MDYVNTLTNMGTIYFNCEQDDEALNFYQEAIRLETIIRKREDEEEGVERIRDGEFLQKVRVNPAVLANIANIYYKKKNM